MKQISLSRKLFILNQRNLHLPKNINGPKTRLKCCYSASQRPSILSRMSWPC